MSLRPTTRRCRRAARAGRLADLQPARPRNAMDATMLDELEQAWHGARRRSRRPGHRQHRQRSGVPDRPRRRAAGREQGGAARAVAPDKRAELLFTPWHPTCQPVICAVNGMCAGGGLHFVADADIVIASSSARSSIRTSRSARSSAFERSRLARKSPFEADHAHGAARAVTSGSAAERAYQLGIVSQVVDPPDGLRDAAQALAETIARNSPAAMAATQAGAVAGARDGPDRRVQDRAPRSRRRVGPSGPGRGPAGVRRAARPVWNALDRERVGPRYRSTDDEGVRA